MKPPIFEEDWTPAIKALHAHDVQEIWDSSVSPHVWNQYHNQLGIYLGLAGSLRKPKKKILDVGCAQGTLALLLAERGHDVVALDLRPAFIEYARSWYTHGHIRFLAGNVLEYRFDERFDLIFANQLIEHLVYPNRLISKLNGVLNPGGRLVVTTPNWHYIRNNLPSFFELGDPTNFEHLQFTADGDGHFFAYRAMELFKIVEAEGLKVVRCLFFELPFISGHMKLRYLHRIFPTRALKLLDLAVLYSPIAKYAAHQLMIIAERPCEASGA